MRAVILAGGEGTRLRPLTLSVPKPVVPVVDRPFLRHQLDLLAGAGVRDVVVHRVPGALEIPLALQWLAQTGHFDCLAAIGCVVRGDTYHFEIVANESARGVMEVALESGIPVANGILTTDTEAQAEARLDKGAEAVRVAVELARLRAGITGAAR